MADKNIAKKEKAIEIMKKMDIYKPYIKGFRESDKVCFFEQFGGFWIDQEPELHAKMKALEEKHKCKVYVSDDDTYIYFNIKGGNHIEEITLEDTKAALKETNRVQTQRDPARQIRPC